MIKINVIGSLVTQRGGSKRRFVRPYLGSEHIPEFESLFSFMKPRWAGVFVGISGGLLLAVTFRTLGKNITDTVVTRAAHTLVTRGPYRWVRHSFYVATALAVLANSLVTANWFLALTGGLCFSLLVLRTRIEEEKLIERFGDNYKEYMKRTGRFLPRLFQS